MSVCTAQQLSSACETIHFQRAVHNVIAGAPYPRVEALTAVIFARLFFSPRLAMLLTSEADENGRGRSLEQYCNCCYDICDKCATLVAMFLRSDIIAVETACLLSR